MPFMVATRDYLTRSTENAKTLVKDAQGGVRKRRATPVLRRDSIIKMPILIKLPCTLKMIIMEFRLQLFKELNELVLKYI